MKKKNKKYKKFHFLKRINRLQNCCKTAMEEKIRFKSQTENKRCVQLQ